MRIKNYKCFQIFEIDFASNINIIVGNNEEGKSTILESLQLVLSGMLNGRILSEVYESLFNRYIVNEYLASLNTPAPQSPPEIVIEVFLNTNELPLFEGDGNSYRTKKCGLLFRICFNEQYQEEYNTLINSSNVNTLPVEYYRIERYSFAREAVTNRSIPLKSVLIDSSSTRFQNGSDVYVSKIIRDNLDEKETTALALSYRRMRESFGNDAAIEAINHKVSENAGISNKRVSVSVDVSVKNSWETVLMTFIDDVPFPQVGKGEQCIIKTNLALAHKRAQTSNLILLEEPENHLSHTRLNELLEKIKEKCADKQLIITTHSNFVANKLRLKNLILLSNQQTTRLVELPTGDAEYFEKLPGYDTLRMILSKKVILVEGPSDELIIQRAYKDKYGVLPIEHGVDVISVRGLSFKRFLDIARRISKKVAVVTDNDGDYANNIIEKYKDYISVGCIKVCASSNDELKTLEPQFVDSNKDNLSELRSLLGIDIASYKTTEEISHYMEANKTDWALAIFNSEKNYFFPQYIIDAIEWVAHERE